MDQEDILFKGKDAIEDWESVDTGAPEAKEEEDYNDFDIEFINMDDVEEGDFWIGEYSRIYKFKKAKSPSVLFENEEEEVTYAFPDHVALKTQLADSDLEENQTRSENPVEQGEVVAIKYNGTTPIEGRPMDMHAWELKRPPE